MTMDSLTSLPKLEDCLDLMKDYLEAYILKMRPGPLPTHLIICQGHPAEKVIVSIVDKEQFEHLNRSNDQVMVDDDYDVEMYWNAKGKKDAEKSPPKKESKAAKKQRLQEEKATEAILKKDVLSKPKPKQTLQFNGVKYEVIHKDSPVAAECWCDEEKIRGLFKVIGTRFQSLFDAGGKLVRVVEVPKVVAKDEVLFVDLIQVKNEKADAEAKEAKRKEIRRVKKDRQRAKKLAEKEAEVKAAEEPEAAA